jgi:hypothetical protein
VFSCVGGVETGGETGAANVCLTLVRSDETRAYPLCPAASSSPKGLWVVSVMGDAGARVSAVAITVVAIGVEFTLSVRWWRFTSLV